MDKDGVPIDLSGGVYIKYNSGGVYTFSDIRKSGLGFDALWKPGDALLEPYDGTYRGKSKVKMRTIFFNRKTQREK